MGSRLPYPTFEGSEGRSSVARRKCLMLSARAPERDSRALILIQRGNKTADGRRLTQIIRESHHVSFTLRVKLEFFRSF